VPNEKFLFSTCTPCKLTASNLKEYLAFEVRYIFGI